MNKQLEQDLMEIEFMEDAISIILDHGVEAAFDILPHYRRQFVNRALFRLKDGLDALEDGVPLL